MSQRNESRVSDMQINVAQLLKEQVGSSRAYRLDENIGADNIDSVRGRVNLTRTKSGILVTCKMTASVTGVCSRCLTPIAFQTNYEFEEEFFPTMDLPSDINLSTDPDSPVIDDRHILDLTEVIRQYAVLAMPAKPLCHPDCAGICPACGHNLNRGSCQCLPQVTDPRWSELTRLRKEG
ncbi:MAG TPA: DUF177 domain-containing protein [Dehalococcoidia bacterium]|nr:DUF177 domain-containing protein [Dehalococcoidia bacterium]